MQSPRDRNIHTAFFMHSKKTHGRNEATEVGAGKWAEYIVSLEQYKGFDFYLHERGKPVVSFRVERVAPVILHRID